jgi:pimeloyl-ACP methyl ester carboxylesterase
MRIAVLVFLLGAFSHSDTWARQDPMERKAGDHDIKQWTLRTVDGEAIPCELGTLYVPENRTKPSSRLIGIGFVRFTALQPTGAPPTIHLPGGPGESYLGSLGKIDDPADVPLAAPIEVAALKHYRAASDAIYFDQRGYSTLGEKLIYTHWTKTYPTDEPDSLARQKEDEVALAKGAVAEFTARGVDLSAYTITECAADVNDLRKALGYERVVLVGHSFGGQLAFATIRLFPHHVARAIISAVEPLDGGYDRPSHVLATLQRLWSGAERSEGFAPYLPEDGSGIAGAMREIMRRLEKNPRQVRILDETKRPVTVTLGPDDFRINPGKPEAILAIYHGRYRAWAKEVWAARQAHQTDRCLIQPLIDVSLGASKSRRQLLKSDFPLTLSGRPNFAVEMATENTWPTVDVGEDFRAEIQTDIPVLFVQGTWDVKTPMENLLEVLPFFVNSRTLIVNHGLHEPWHYPLVARPDVTAAVLNFVRTGATSDLPSSVTIEPRGFPPPRFKIRKKSN